MQTHWWRNPFILAPMAGVTDLPFRRLCHQLGAGMVVTEMVNANPRLRDSTETQKKLNHDDECHPKAVQIAGGDAQTLAAFARYNEDRGADIIDINMGCPMKKICKKAAGSALLSDLNVVAEICETVVQAVTIPVTLKIRTGPCPASRNALEVARIAENAGIQALAIHGRTRACAFNGYAEYDTIKQVKESIGIPVIANGDIETPAQAINIMQYTGADAVMIGRAAQGSPWIFQDCLDYLNTQHSPKARSLSWIASVLTEHLDALYQFYGISKGILMGRKHVGWYAKAHPEAHHLRQQFNSLSCHREQLACIETFFC